MEKKEAKSMVLLDEVHNFDNHKKFFIGGNLNEHVCKYNYGDRVHGDMVLQENEERVFQISIQLMILFSLYTNGANQLDNIIRDDITKLVKFPRHW